jgi:hypothetical protein
MFETSDKNGWIMEEFSKAVPYPVAYSLTSEIYKIAPNVTDFTSFLNAGKSGLNFANLGGLEIYHNPQDTPENLDRGFLQHQGSYALSLANHFGNIPLDGVQGSNDSVFFTLARSVMVLYPVQWNIPLTIVMLMLLAAALIIGFRKQLVNLKGIVRGFLVSMLSIVVATVFGIAAQLLFTGTYYKLANVQSLSDLVDLRRTLVFHGNTWIVVSLILSVALLFLLQRVFGKKIAGCNLLMGNVVIWSILAVISAMALPGAGYMILWPALLTLAGLLIDFLFGRGSGPRYLATVLLSILACVLIFLPVGYLLYQSLTMLAAVIPIALLSIPVSLMLLTAALFVGKKGTFSATVCDNYSKSL